MSVAVVLLAAGQGTRMNSKKPKILHEVGGRPMVMHAFWAAEVAADLPPVLVVPPDADAVRALPGERAMYVVQPVALGTGDAVRMASGLLRGRADQVLVTYADMPLLRPKTLSMLAEQQSRTGAVVALLSVFGDETSSFGRVIRDTADHVSAIVEVAEARRRPDADALLAVRELNVGVYCFDAEWLWANIDALPLRQARGAEEYYLTDLVSMAVEQGRFVEAVVATDPDEGLGAGTRAEMVAVERAFRRRINNYWLANGVTIVEPDATYIGPDVVIGQDTVLWPNTFLQGDTRIDSDCVIGPNTILRDVLVGEGCRIEQVFLERIHVPEKTIVRTGEWLSPPQRKGVV